MRNILLTLIALVLISCGGEMPSAAAPANANLTPPEFAWEEEAPTALDLGGPSARYAVPGDERWVSMNPEISGTDGIVWAMVRDGDYLYIAGSFSFVKNIEANRIARLTISTGEWRALGAGIDNVVFALAVDAHGILYAGGEFSTAGEETVNNIAKWDGFTWAPLGSGISGAYNGNGPSVRSLAVDENGNVYAGGLFSTAGSRTVNNIAQWDGGAWSSLGIGVTGVVHAIAIDVDDNLYIGGGFNKAGDVWTESIAKWDGTAWNTVGSGMGGTDHSVYSLVIDMNGNIIAGGEFQIAGEVTAKCVAKWNGITWSALGDGMSRLNGSISKVHTLSIDKEDNIYAGGDFNIADGKTTKYIAKWDGSSWNDIAGGMDNQVLTLAIDENDNLYTGGVFNTAGDVAAEKIAQWNGTAWISFGRGINREVQTLIVDEDENLYLGGSFTAADGRIVNHVVKWDGSTWNALGSGMSGGNGYTYVNVLASDGLGNIYAGGRFSTAGEVMANNIAKWDGASWNALGNGMSYTINTTPYVHALAVDGIGNVYAGGEFTIVDGVTVNRIAKWNGNSWVSLGSGMNNIVNVLVLDEDGNLYVGGRFTTAGGVPANRIAKWDGISWTALGTGINSTVSALVVDKNGDLYAGGFFTVAGGVPANNIAKWDGTSWNALGTGTNSTVSALALDGKGNLYVGGRFTMAGEATVNRIAKWDGMSWSALGSGISTTPDHTPYVNILAIDAEKDLYTGGSFTMAGDKMTRYFAKYLDHLPGCGDGVIDGEEECEGTEGLWGDCCDTATCRFKVSAVTCRAATDSCDAEEKCSGASDICPVDVKALEGSSCSDGNNCSYGDLCFSGSCIGINYTCDAPGTCEKVEGAICYGDGTCIYPAAEPGTACGDSSDTICDNSDTCDGNKNCLFNYEPPTTICRNPAGECDAVEYCDENGSCPADGKSSDLCRFSEGTCDAVEFCDGTNDGCPAEEFTSVNGNVCDDESLFTENDTCLDGVCMGTLVSGLCETAIAIDPLPYTATSTTVGRPNALNAYGAACGNAGKPSPDIIYALAVEAGVEYLIEVAPEASYDVTINLLGACQNNEVCLGVANGGGEGDTEAIIYSSASPRTIYIALEGTAKNEVGSYEISVTTVEAPDDTPPTDADTVDEIVIEPDDATIVIDIDMVEDDDDSLNEPDEDIASTDDEEKDDKDIGDTDDENADQESIVADTDTVVPDSTDTVAADTDISQPDETVDESVDVATDETVDSTIEDIDTILPDEQPPVDADTTKPTGNGCGCSLAF